LEAVVEFRGAREAWPPERRDGPHETSDLRLVQGGL